MSAAVYEDILVPLISADDDEPSLVAAQVLEAKFHARLTALIVAVHLGSAYAEEAQPLSDVLNDIASGSRSAAAQERARIVERLASHAFEVRDVTVEGAVHDNRVAAHARMSDLIIATRADAHERARRGLIETILFKSGRPVLLMPHADTRARAWDKIVIGWNASAEAVRAVSGALPLLQTARKVVVATVDATPTGGGHGEAPGRELAAYLARRGVAVEVQNIDGMGRTPARALLDAAVALDADALVLGAYGHTRAQEWLFGGVTRDLLAASPIPLLMAH